MSTSALRALIGFILAPGTPALMLYFVNLIVVSHQEALLLAAILATLAYLAALIIGVPVFFFLQQKGINSLVTYLLLGALIGLACCVVLFGAEVLLSSKTYTEHVRMLLKNSWKSGVVAMVYGSVANLIFWLIAVRRDG